MSHNEWSDAQPGADSSSSASESFVRQEKRAAEGLFNDAKAAAADAGDQAKKLASDKAAELQGAAAGHLRVFADAVRAAGDELADKEPGPVSDLVRQAAEGLERFSGALGRKSSSEMIDGVREFGRQNPVGFLAGTMLAGFALARFAGSGAPKPQTGPSGYREAGRPNEAFGADTTAGVYEGRTDTIPPQSFEESWTEGTGPTVSQGNPSDTGADPGAGMDPSGEQRPREGSSGTNWRTDI